MSATRYLGISFYNNHLQLAEVEHGKAPQVTVLAEQQSEVDLNGSLSGTDPQIATLAAELKQMMKRNKVRAEIISFAVPTDAVFINVIPVDIDLYEGDLQKHLQWELAQYNPSAGPRDFVIDSHALPLTNTEAQDMFMVGVQRGTAAFIQKVTAELNLTMNIIDIDQFSTEKTLIANYPEILEHDIVLFGLRGDSLDASVIHEGQMTDYRLYHENDATKAVRDYLKYLGERYNSRPAGLLLHGINVTQDIVMTLREETGIKQTVALNSLRKVSASDKLSLPMRNESQKFAAAIGLALRSK
jgi:Tfp pilus assembly PilM family ATPase